MRIPLRAAALAASLILQTASAHADSVRGNGDLPSGAGGEAAIFEAKHAVAWTEIRNGKPFTLIYLFDREPPSARWIDAEERGSAITAWMLDAKAPMVRWELDDKNAADGVMVCNTEGMCSSRGVSVINDIPSARADVKANAGRLAGKLEITELKVLDQAAVANIRTRAGSGKDAWDLECRVLLRKEGTTWKIGSENC